jgi:C4-dicarboxylate transporter, DctQ subunit
MSESTNKSLSAFSQIQKKIATFIDWFEVSVLCAGIFSLAVLLIANVIARTFFRGIYFVEELSEFLVVLITFVGVSYAVRKARHIRMGAIFDAMGPRLQKAFIFIICGTSAAVMFLMASYSYKYMTVARKMLHFTPALRLPYWLFLIIIPLGFASAGMQYIRTIIKNIVEKEVWLSPEQQSEYEEEEQMVKDEIKGYLDSGATG